MPTNDDLWLLEASIQISAAQFELLGEECANTGLAIETFRNELLNLKELNPAGFAALMDSDPSTES